MKRLARRKNVGEDEEKGKDEDDENSGVNGGYKDRDDNWDIEGAKKEFESSVTGMAQIT